MYAASVALVVVLPKVMVRIPAVRTALATALAPPTEAITTCTDGWFRFVATNTTPEPLVVVGMRTNPGVQRILLEAVGIGTKSTKSSWNRKS